MIKALPNAAALSGLLILAGCNQAGLPDFTTTNSVFAANTSAAYNHVLAERRPVEEAMVQLPQRAGTILEVIQGRSGNGIKQRIVLKGDTRTPGQNMVDVRMVSHRIWPKVRKDDMGVHSTKLAILRANMRSEFPGITMGISSVLSTNPYGPFGYALGRTSSGVRCLYGWQNVAGKGREPWGIFTKRSRRPELSVRVRLCRSDVTDRQLVAFMRQLRIDADPARITQPSAVSWRAGRGQDVHALTGVSRQGYISEKPVMSYQPEGLVQPKVEPTATRAKRAKPVVRKPARSQTRTTARTPRVVPTVRKPAVRQVRRRAVAVPTPTQAASIKSLAAKAGPRTTASALPVPGGVAASISATVPAVPAVAPPETSLIVLPRAAGHAAASTEPRIGSHPREKAHQATANTVPSVPKVSALTRPKAPASNSASPKGPASSALVLPLPTEVNSAD
ncbi:MAG: cellulose biosynthesis protein BcsN [Pseudomonadota bacterium]